MRYPGKKYVTKYQLIKANEAAIANDYNRQLEPSFVGSLPDLNFPIEHTLIHRHRHGEECEPHMRCVVMVPDGNWITTSSYAPAFVDVPMEVYESFPVAEESVDAC